MTAACDNTRFIVSQIICQLLTVNAKILRDTGCSSVVIRRDLVSREKLTGVSKMCVLLSATGRKFPVARICVSSPYLIGKCEALCAVYDLILGVIPVVRNPSDLMSWKKRMF